ncbi:ABC transporter permease [Nitriliruptor alkaliphilus]|uniref:ABC transporter permease n=1 Tax=Nitriliruptor alkaliphilus TaxID=427918 RepID=UPI0006963008|nr:ABC transporter permease [Nitriliruptor alkaliphilus]
MSALAPSRRFALERRVDVGPGVLLAVPVLSILAALVVGGIFLSAIGLAPLAVYREILRVSYTTGYGIADSLVSASALILTGLAAAVAFRFKLYNIGGEGQLYVGAIAASGAALLLGDGTSAVVLIPVVIVAGMAGGAAWVAVPALARAYLNTSEIITSLLLNYVALSLLQYLIFGADTMWRDPDSPTFPRGAPVPAEALFPRYGTTRVHLGLVLAVVAAVVLAFVISRTRWGFRWRLFGDSPSAARYAGVPSRQVIIVILLLSGALAGLAGAGEVVGRTGRLDATGLVLNLGYNGIIVAALARYNPLAVVPVGILLGGILNAGPALQALPGQNVPTAISTTLTGAILIFALAGELFVRYRVTRPQPRGADDEPAATPGGAT